MEYSCLKIILSYKKALINVNIAISNKLIDIMNFIL